MTPQPQAASAPPPDLEARLAEPAGGQPFVYGRVVCPGVLVVGRMPRADVVLPADDRQAARMHFHVRLDAEHCRLINHSEHGTFVNGLLVHAECDLRHGDLVRAGRSVFAVWVLRRGEPAELARSPTVLWQPHADPTTAPPAEAPPLVPPALMPRELAGYKRIRELGRGGMGTVWLAEDRAGQQVAFKLIHHELALNPLTCARFRRETNHLRDLRHRHIVGFREAGEVEGLLFLVMDYVPGSSLAELLARDGPFAVGRAVRLTCQVLDALEEAHKNGFVHRDVKPSNVLVQSGPEEEVRLADFGMAKAYQTADVGQSVTLPGVIGGTLMFAAPEMVNDFRRAGPPADQYGAAATLYNLLTASHPHTADDPVRLVHSIRNRDATPLEQHRSSLPVGLTGAVHRALERDPRRRFPTVSALRDALSPYAD
jgi:serine/threonine-protein kinase